MASLQLFPFSILPCIGLHTKIKPFLFGFQMPVMQASQNVETVL